MNAITYRGRRVFTGHSCLAPGHVTVDGAAIAAVGPEPPPGVPVADLGGHDLLPGLIDLHSDCWLHRARPRTSSTFPLEDTLVALDTEVVAWGITTHYVCITVQDDAAKGRTIGQARRSAEIVTALRDDLRADHRIHLRVEATTDRIDVAAELAALPPVSLLSYMDHTPGQGQFTTEEDWRAYYASTGEADLDALLAHRRARQPDTETIRPRIAAIARQHGLALASHDDDTTARIELAHRLGVRIAEFPVTATAAAAATACGLLTVMGAPNALRGTSHLNGNLSARSALQAGHLGALASDYHPPSLLTAIYALAADGLCDLVAATALVTSRPAQAAGLTDRGTLAPGQRADLIAVRLRAGRPVISQTWIAGQPAFGVWQ